MAFKRTFRDATQLIAEQVVLGHILLDPEEKQLEIIESLLATDFVNLATECIFRACVALLKAGTPIDEITVAHALCGGDQTKRRYIADYVALLTTVVGNADYATGEFVLDDAMQLIIGRVKDEYL